MDLRINKCIASFSIITLALISSHSLQASTLAVPQNKQDAGRQVVSYQFDIEAKALSKAITDFSAVTNIQVLYTGIPTAQYSTGELKGSFTAEQALNALLAGSHIRYRFVAKNAVILEQAPVKSANGPLTLGPITVTTAAGYAQEIKDSPASISVLSNEALEKRPFSSLQDIASEVPGVSVIGSGANSGISIRGMPKGYTLVLVDGKRVRSETANPRELNNEDLDSSFIPPASVIERVEVVRGPMSSLYGSDAMGGVINIITKKTPEKWRGSVGYGFQAPDSGSMSNKRQADFYLSGPLLKNVLGASLWGNEVLQDEDKYLGGYQESDKRTIGGKINVAANEYTDLTFDFSSAKQRYIGNPGNVLKETSRAAIDREWTRDAWGVAYNGRFDLGDLEIKYYQEDYERYRYPLTYEFTTTAENKVVDARFLTGIGRHLVTTGLQWTKDKQANNDLGGGHSGSFGEKEVTDWAIFAEDEWELISQKLYLTLGARLTDNEYFGHHTSPRAYFVYNHNKNLTFKGGIATGYKSPKITQVDDTTGSSRGGGSNQFVIMGNPALKPEKSTNYELSALYNNQSVNVGATVFYNDFSNKILSTQSYFFTDNNDELIAAYCDSGSVGTQMCPAWATWLNADGATIQGIELDASWEISKKLAIKLNYTYTDSSIDASNVVINTPAGARPFGDTLAQLNGNSLVGIPDHNGSIVFNYYPTDSLSGYLKANYEGQITRVDFDRNAVNKSDKDLATLDAGLRYVLSEQVSLNFTIDNLTNTKRFKVREDTGAFRFSERGRSYFMNVKVVF